MASARFRSSVKDSLDRLSHTKWLDKPRTVASYPRENSPTSGRSILMTRAPKSASWRVANGAATACSRDTTVIPASGSINTTWAGPERAPPDNSELDWWKWGRLDTAAFRGIYARCRTLRQSRNRRTFAPRHWPTPRKRRPPAASPYSLRGRTLCRHRTGWPRARPSAGPPPDWRTRGQSGIESPDFFQLAWRKQPSHSRTGKCVPETSAHPQYIPKQ